MDPQPAPFEPAPVERTAVPLVAGADDYDVLQALNLWLPATFAEHVAFVEEAGAELAETGMWVDIVPLWAPLFLLWCAERGISPSAPDALAAWAERDSAPFVAYTAYEYGPLEPIADLEAIRSQAIAAIASRPEHHSCRAVLQRWAAATALLASLRDRTAHGAEINVHVGSCDPIHWHLDGTSCGDSVVCEDLAHAGLMAAIGIGGWMVLTERPDDSTCTVRVWQLGGEAGVTPLSSIDAAAVCTPGPGTTVASAWGLPAGAT